MLISQFSWHRTDPPSHACVKGQFSGGGGGGGGWWGEGVLIELVEKIGSDEHIS